MPSFYNIYAAAVNIDAYVLLEMLYKETGEDKYLKSKI